VGVVLAVEVKDGFISLFVGNYRKFANQNIYLFYVNQRFTKALNDNVQLGIFGTLAPHDEKNYRNHRYKGSQRTQHVDLSPGS
jgi:hypothetical protein